MALDNKVVLVDAALDLLLTADNDGTTFSIVNKTGEVLYLGASDVTANEVLATGGLPVAIDGTFSGVLNAGESIYGVTASTGGAVPIIFN